MSEIINQSEQNITEFMRGMAAGGDALRELKKYAAAGGTEFEALQKVIVTSGAVSSFAGGFVAALAADTFDMHLMLGTDV
ncbi:MAG: hypothetical protein HOP24_05465 [Sideroxydans sp.]|nr:hypothetical protein [Sideroxydans sp.]